MPTFPKLKTGAAAQHPAAVELRYQTESLRFLDASEQRYRDQATAKRRWIIPLDQLDATELAEIRHLFEQTRGALGAFDFEDPWSGDLIPNCRFADDELSAEADSDWNLRSTLTVVEG